MITLILIAIAHTHNDNDKTSALRTGPAPLSRLMYYAILY